jgi:hypothetical protein
MSESRDSNDPRDAMRRMRKEAEAEFDRAESEQTGGQEHASRAEREGAGRDATGGSSATEPGGSGAGRDRA